MSNLTQAQMRELKKVNTLGIIKVFRSDKAFKIYKALESKGLIQVAWSTSCSVDYKVLGKDTRGLY